MAEDIPSAESHRASASVTFSAMESGGITEKQEGFIFAAIFLARKSEQLNFHGLSCFFFAS